MIESMDIMTEIDPIHEAVLQAWECAFVGMPITYLSGPITTGKRYVELVESGMMSPTVRRQLIKKNCDALKAKALQLRLDQGGVVLEPASLTVNDWSQRDYLALWQRLIEKHVKIVLFMPGWEYSVGCVTEFVKATTVGIRTETITKTPLSLKDGLRLVTASCEHIKGASSAQDSSLQKIREGLQSNLDVLTALMKPEVEMDVLHVRKDESLDMLADKMNVAQFVSFAPIEGVPVEQYSRISDELPNQKNRTIYESIELLFVKSADQSINVRSYHPNDSQSREFVYGLNSVREAVQTVERLSKDGLHTIVNETIDVSDGGVSGVLMGNLLEFSPDDTPRCVEKPGNASLPKDFGIEMLTIVYGAAIQFDVPIDSRLEFSIHPKPCGWRKSHILAWEYASQEAIDTQVKISWPNNFSKIIGDKAYGLLVAHLFDLPVPFTTVIGRRIAPFSFGRETGQATNWIRTSPREQVPGKFTTHQGWLDPFELLSLEDPQGDAISSVLNQRGVLQKYSGALIVGGDGEIIIEGKAGEGESLMLGTSPPQSLPERIMGDVQSLYNRAKKLLGPVRFEWVHDGEIVWIVQLHVGATSSSDDSITDLKAKNWREFDVSKGLDSLRSVVDGLPSGTGIKLSQRVGLTSHFADVLRRANVPAKMI